MATMAYATRQLARWGATIEAGRYTTGRKAHVVVEVLPNGSADEVSTVWVRREWEQDDPITDYWGGASFDSMKAAIAYADEMMRRDVAQVRLYIETGETHGMPGALIMRKAAKLQAYGLVVA